MKKEALNSSVANRLMPSALERDGCLAPRQASRHQPGRLLPSPVPGRWHPLLSRTETEETTAGCAQALTPQTAGSPGTPAQWADALWVCWAKGRTQTLEKARLLFRARESLRPLRQWSAFFSLDGKRLPVSKRKAEHFVVIGRELGVASANTCSHLPSGWRTLYCLAKLGLPLVERLIAEGQIHSGLTLSEARALLERFEGALQRPRQSRMKQRVARFVAFVRENWANTPDTDKCFTEAALLALLQDTIRVAGPGVGMRETIEVQST